MCQKPWYLNGRLWKFDATYYKNGDLNNKETPHHAAFAEPDKYHWSEDEAVSVNDSRLVEDDFFTSQDGLKLHYWFVKGKPTMPAVIVIHGHHDCMGRWETANPMNVLYRAGFTYVSFQLLFICPWFLHHFPCATLASTCTVTKGDIPHPQVHLPSCHY